ncbi:hypothetical protein HPB49_005120 [Dermacentor silvarum]|uniref:Uncharacterized protein n=1 Tax=Dermacentor silvarum TaxID=543639 RepID=A0ACB8D351_DERSI|nr:hypothetical protein HPB49_005120 [Dermacentor silvarum]
MGQAVESPLDVYEYQEHDVPTGLCFLQRGYHVCSGVCIGPLEPEACSLVGQEAPDTSHPVQPDQGNGLHHLAGGRGRLAGKTSGPWPVSGQDRGTCPDCQISLKKLLAEVRVRQPVLPKRSRPRQRHHYGAYGHVIAACASEQRCLRCGGTHPRSACAAKQAACLNCGGPHVATEPRWPSWQHERKVAETLTASCAPSRVQPGRSYSDAVCDRLARALVAGNTSTPPPRSPAAVPDSHDAVIALLTAPHAHDRPCRSPNTGQPWQLDLRVPPGRAYCIGTAAPCAADTLSSQNTFLCTTTMSSLYRKRMRVQRRSRCQGTSATVVLLTVPCLSVPLCRAPMTRILLAVPASPSTCAPPFLRCGSPRTTCAPRWRVCGRHCARHQHLGGQCLRSRGCPPR